MAQTTNYDSLKFDSLDFPYNKILSELSPVVRLVNGNNTYVTFGGKLVKRYGTKREANCTLGGLRRIDRTVLYRTLEATPKIYIVASVYNPGTSLWELWHNRLSGPAPGWVNTSVANLRQCNSSTRAHEMVVSRGMVYIKGFPSAASGEKLGSVIFDGTGAPGPTGLTIWGILPPATPARVDPPGGWGASTHAVTVKTGWSYVYCYVTKSGHVSSHSQLETNPDNNPSNTGAFTNKIPSIKVIGLADTTNVPTINLYRTLDGGGTFYFVKALTNTGAGVITTLDNQGVSSTGPDPVADVTLGDSVIAAPTTVSNNPPPTVIAPKVVGTDTPDASTPMVTYSGRIWYAINNVVFYSASEEIVDGIPEEAWPSGVKGNFFKFPYPVVNLISTSLALLVITTDAIYQIPGSSRDTFNAKPLFSNIGGAENVPRAAIPMGDNAIWLTNDYRIAVVRNSNLEFLSSPLSRDIYETYTASNNTDIQIEYWAQEEKDFVLVAVWDKNLPANSKLWVYDVAKSSFLRLDFWNTPWNIHATHMISGRIKESSAEHVLSFCMYEGSSGSQISVWDSTGVLATDDEVTQLAVPYGFSFDTFLAELPPGNHTNTLSVPGKFPVVDAIVMDRTQYKNDTDPRVYAYFDDFWTKPVQLPSPVPPERRTESLAYRTLVYAIKNTAQHCAFRITKGANTERFALQNFFIRFNPVAGT